MRAGLYLRISRDREGQGLGVERQKLDTLALAKAKKWEVADVYADDDRSAIKYRPEWERLLADIESGKIEAVVSYSSSRLYRSLEDMLRLSKLAPAVQTVASGTIDFSTADGRMIAGVLASVDTAERERVGERQKRKHLELREVGKWTGGRVPFGYRPNDAKLDVYEPEARLIRDAAVALLNGQSLRSIERAWNAAGALTTGGKPWRAGHVRRVMHRPNPGILTDSDTRRLVALLDAPGRGKQGGKAYMLTGLLYCGLCGERMKGRPKLKGKNAETGHYVQTYACLRSGRLHLTIPAAPVNHEVLVQAFAKTLTRRHQVADPSAPLVAEREELTAKLRELGKRFAAGDAFAESAAESIRQRLGEIEVELVRDAPDVTYESDLAERVKARAEELTGDDVDVEVRTFSRATLEELIERVTIAPGRGSAEERVSIEWREGVTDSSAIG